MNGYKTRKAAQVSAFFALKQGGSINVLKLMKLLYLSDRAHLAEYDSPILFDYFVSMPHGPVESLTYNAITGGAPEPQEWDNFIAGRGIGEYEISVRENISPENLDELSRAECKTLEAVWEKFGHMTQYQIRDWTHSHCGEWEDPHGSSAPIPYARVLKFLGKKQAEKIAEKIEDLRNLDTALENAR